MDTGKTRQRLRQLADEIPVLLDTACGSSPLWRGIVHDARRKCGKPNCRCQRGELHTSTILADRSGSKLRNLPVRGRQHLLFTEMTEEYRKVRRARARLVKITREMLGIFDRLEEVRRQEAVRRHGAKLPPPRPPKPS
jgi:hypothetical protein